MKKIIQRSLVLPAIEIAKKFYKTTPRGDYEEGDHLLIMELEAAEKIISSGESSVDHLRDIEHLLGLVAHQLRERNLSLLASEVEKAVSYLSEFCETEEAGQADVA